MRTKTLRNISPILTEIHRNGQGKHMARLALRSKTVLPIGRADLASTFYWSISINENFSSTRITHHAYASVSQWYAEDRPYIRDQ